MFFNLFIHDWNNKSARYLLQYALPSYYFMPFCRRLFGNDRILMFLSNKIYDSTMVPVQWNHCNNNVPIWSFNIPNLIVYQWSPLAYKIFRSLIAANLFPISFVFGLLTFLSIQRSFRITNRPKIGTKLESRFFFPHKITCNCYLMSMISFAENVEFISCSSLKANLILFFVVVVSRIFLCLFELAKKPDIESIGIDR